MLSLYVHLRVLQSCSSPTLDQSFMSVQLRMRHLLQAARVRPGASQEALNSLSGHVIVSFHIERAHMAVQAPNVSAQLAEIACPSLSDSID